MNKVECQEPGGETGPRFAIIKFSELGKNCWLPRRFLLDGSRCDRVWTCSYPEKKTCHAVKAEIRYMMGEQKRLVTVYQNIDTKLKELAEMLEK